jgi:hypothetical protein
VGIDWAEAHDDVCLLDAAGTVLASRRTAEGLERLATLHALLGDYAATPDEMVVGIETERGLLITALLAAGYQVYAINPLAAARTASGTPPAAPSPTAATPRCWPTWCAPTATTTARWRPTASCSARSGSLPAATRA